MLRLVYGRAGIADSSRLLTKVIACAALIISITSCTRGTNEDSDKPNKVEASAACDSGISDKTVESLRSLLGSDKFMERPDSDLKKAANKIRQQSDSRPVEICRLYRDDSGTPAMTVDFSWVDDTPGSVPENGDTVTYDLGMHARSTAGTAKLYFSCTSAAPDPERAILRGTLWAPKSELEGSERNEQQMIVLNSLSRAVAERLSCATTANLPEHPALAG